MEAFVLAGGQSKRFGTNKALYKVGSETLIETICNKLSGLFDRVRVVSRDEIPLGEIPFDVLRDLRSERCPLTGIYSGLKYLGVGQAFFVACDLPLVRIGLVEYIVSKSRGFEAVVPRTSSGLEPLLAVYDASCVESIESAFASKNFRTDSFLETVRVRWIEEEELRKCDPRLLSFWNVNVPEDMGLVIDTIAKERTQRCS